MLSRRTESQLSFPCLCTLLCLGSLSVLTPAEAFVPSTPKVSVPSVCGGRTRRTSAITSTTFRPTRLRGLLDDFLGSDSEQKDINEIPPELKDEIYRAESNTSAAQGRTLRIAAYIFLTLTGVTTAFGNAFLTDLRFGDGSPSDDLAYYGFGWVQENFLFSFLLTNGIGGALGLLVAGLCGTLAEVETRSQKENAEQIWAEMQRRKVLKEKPPSSKKKKKRTSLAQPLKKNMTGKQRKRLAALSELMEEEKESQENVEEITAESAASSFAAETEGGSEDTSEKEAGGEKNDGGIMGTLKGFYEKADNMAASQALLLNKELEDKGIVDKITDESGLKVIGKEAASKLRKEKEGGPSE